MKLTNLCIYSASVFIFQPNEQLGDEHAAVCPQKGDRRNTQTTFFNCRKKGLIRLQKKVVVAHIPHSYRRVLMHSLEAMRSATRKCAHLERQWQSPSPVRMSDAGFRRERAIRQGGARNTHPYKEKKKTPLSKNLFIPVLRALFFSLCWKKSASCYEAHTFRYKRRRAFKRRRTCKQTSKKKRSPHHCASVGCG